MSGVGPRRPNTVTAVTRRAANRRIDLHFCSSASRLHAFVIAIVCRVHLLRNSVCSGCLVIPDLLDALVTEPDLFTILSRRGAYGAR